jgi:hypothetical protein
MFQGPISDIMPVYLSHLPNRLELHGVEGFYSSGERKVKRRSAPDLSLGPDSSPVPVYDALDGRKPYARPFEFGHRVQSLKRAEEFIRVSHIEARSVVAHEVDGFSIEARAAEFYLCPLLLFRKLPRVAQKIFERDVNESRVSLG